MPIDYKGNDQFVLDVMNAFSTAVDGTIHIIEDLNLFKTPQNIGKTILISDGLQPKDLFSIVHKYGIHQIVQKSSTDFKEKMRSAISLHAQEDVLEKIDNIFGFSADKYILKLPIFEGAERFDIYNKVKDFLEQRQVSQSIIEVLLMITYELVSNVLYDAPFYYEQNFSQKKNKGAGDVMGQFVIYMDSQKIFIASDDEFGSLDFDKMIESVLHSYSQEMIYVKDGPVGAGIGCRMMFDYFSDIFITLEKKKRTFVGGIVPIKSGLRKLQIAPKGFHFLEI